MKPELIIVDPSDKAYMDTLKVHPRQAYAAIVAILVGEYKQAHPETTVEVPEKVEETTIGPVDSGTQSESSENKA